MSDMAFPPTPEGQARWDELDKLAKDALHRAYDPNALDRFYDWPTAPNLTPTIKDIVTGNTAKLRFSASLFWWAEGNGSCDCNRDEFPPDDDVDDNEPGPVLGESLCASERFIVIDVESDDGPIDDATKALLIAEMNQGYPK